MPKFNIGDILANYSGGLDKPAYEVVDNADGEYRLKQIPSGSYFTWKYAIIEANNALYIAPVIPNGTVVCYTPESLTCTVRGVEGPDYILERHDGGLTFLSSRVIAGACEESVDPCIGVACRDYECVGYDLYSQKCVGGVCVRNELVQSNSLTCGYEAPYVPPEPSPAKGNVYNLDYPANAKNGESITIKASVVNVGGTRGEFSLRVIAAPSLPLVTRYVGWIAPYTIGVMESMNVTMPRSGAVANLGVQCIRHI